MYSIRRARVSDSVELGVVFEDAFAAYHDAGLQIPPVAEGLDQDIRDHSVWVAEDDFNLLGGLIMGISGKHAHLILVAVTPAAGGKGIGKALIDAAVEFARKSEVQEIGLATHRQLQNNLALYEHLGWVRTGIEGDKVLMTRTLSKEPNS